MCREGELGPGYTTVALTAIDELSQKVEALQKSLKNKQLVLTKVNFV
jgi:hypothetical protein